MIETLHIWRCERGEHELAITDDGKPDSLGVQAAIDDARRRVGGRPCTVKRKGGRACGKTVSYYTETKA